MACLYIVSINVRRRWWPWLCVRVCSALPGGAPAPAATAVQQWPPAACARHPALQPRTRWGETGAAVQAWHPQGPWAESVRAGLTFNLASERPRAGQGRDPAAFLDSRASLSGLQLGWGGPPPDGPAACSPCHPCPYLCVKKVSRSGGTWPSHALPLGPRLWSWKAAGLGDACEESLKRERPQTRQRRAGFPRGGSPQQMEPPPRRVGRCQGLGPGTPRRL